LVITDFEIGLRVVLLETLHPKGAVGQGGVGRNHKVRPQWNVVTDLALEVDFLALSFTTSRVGQRPTFKIEFMVSKAHTGDQVQSF